MSRATLIAALSVLLTTSLGVSGRARQRDQTHIDWGAPPSDMSAAYKGGNLVIRVRVVAGESEDYPMQTTRGIAVPLASTVYHLDILEVFKDEEGATAGQRQTILRHPGYLARSGKGQAVEELPEIAAGRECVVFANVSQKGTVWLAYGPDGVYCQDEEAKVASRGHGNVARNERGAPWASFLNHIREAGRASR